MLSKKQWTSISVTNQISDIAPRRLYKSISGRPLGFKPAPFRAGGAQKGATGIATLPSDNLLAPSWCQRGLLGTPRTGPRAPWRHPSGHKMIPKELQIRAWAPKIGPRALKIDPQGAQTDPQTFKMDTLSSKSRPPKLPQSTPWSRFSVLCSQLTSGLFVHQNCFLN